MQAPTKEEKAQPQAFIGPAEETPREPALGAELARIHADIEENRRLHDEQKVELEREFERQAEQARIEVSERLQKLFDKRASKLRVDSDPAGENIKQEIEGTVRRQLEEKFTFRLREEKARMCVELKTKVEGEVRKEMARRLADSEGEIRDRVVQEIEDDIRRDIERQRTKSLQLEFAKLSEDYKAKVEAHIRELKARDYQEQVARKVDELQKDAADQIEAYSSKVKQDVQTRLQSHIDSMNSNVLFPADCEGRNRTDSRRRRSELRQNAPARWTRTTRRSVWPPSPSSSATRFTAASTIRSRHNWRAL